MAGECQTAALDAGDAGTPDAGDAGMPDGGDAGMPDAGDAGPIGGLTDVPLFASRLWILSHASIPSGLELALLPPLGQSHLAAVSCIDLNHAGHLGDPPPACPLVDLSFPNAVTPEALLELAVAPSPHLGVSQGSIYVQGSRHLMTLSR